MTAAAILARTKALIASPTKWCQGHSYIRSQDGTILRRDLMAALLDASRENGKFLIGTPEYMKAQRALFEETGNMGLTVFNDSLHTTHAHVYALIERAERRVQ